MARIITKAEIEWLFKQESSRYPPKRDTPKDDTYFEVELYERIEDVK